MSNNTTSRITFNVDPVFKKKVQMKALEKDVSLTDFVIEAIEEKLNKETAL